MPADRDEEPSPAAGPPAAPRPQWRPATPLAATAVAPGAAAAAPSGGFAWGVVGFPPEAAELTAVPGSRGVVRFVSGDVSYVAPPLAGGWKPTPGVPGSFEMPWAGDPAAARTLAHLRADLDRGGVAGAFKSAASPLLAELDAAAEGLLAAAAKLHAAGWTLGLVLPANVAWGAAREPHLIDLGYTWQGAYDTPPWDASPGRPAWLDDTATHWLSDIAPVRRQFADPSGTHFPRVEPVEDVRTLARLFAWLLTGKKAHEVVPANRAMPAALWALLAEAAAGKVPTARAFGDRLAETPLSRHFTAELGPVAPPTNTVILTPPPPPAKSALSWLLPLAGVAIVVTVAGVGAAMYLTATPDPGPVSTTTSTTKQTDPPPPPPPTPLDFAPLLADVDAALAKKDGAAAAPKLQELYAVAPVTAADAKVRQERREKSLDLWVVDYTAVAELARQPSRRLDAVAQLKALEARLRPLADGYPLPPDAAALTTKEKQCLEFAALLARQLGS